MLHFAEEKPGDPEMGYLTGVGAFVAEQGLEPRPLDLIQGGMYPSLMFIMPCCKT